MEPQLDIWMISQLFALIDQEHSKRLQDTLRPVDPDADKEKLKEYIDSISKNKYHGVGQMVLIRERLQQIMDSKTPHP